ncbi:hypothetical protein GUY44_24545 [Pimelobacter simplex]|uniref:Uncharacterized protein n=1 Tax=Nocardioides simplex TaxID=2045 RepID=A0A0A1DNG9_NOCSI|nr:hypothetical protein [Pimelobacter simplex]AIY18073.1 hypothetical protein KR76_17185 [Pimelobacter simplex]MCG8153667.1 hypothetical protein [Pimelobacter simplex]GEB17143.1 hypothetical protein NSI01_54580 [Pimelobacter simplex]SFN08471.1 hypothetical protein SAMN05421671_5030 [Pimelobacter simplex]
MKKKPVVAAATGLVGLMASGLTISLLAWPADAGSASGSDGNLAVKREEDTPDVVLVVDDDDDDPADALRARQGADTNTNTRATRTRATQATKATGNSRDNTRTGARSGRDDSRSGRAVRDWTQDGPGPKVRDWSRNHTNDRSRHNTRG